MRKEISELRSQMVRACARARRAGSIALADKPPVAHGGREYTSSPMVNLRGEMPSTLRAQARWVRLGVSDVPAMVVHPDWERGEHMPVVLWMHGRTVNKELDPGRYLRWMRAGIGACAVDLPGHGERFDAALHEPERTFEVVEQMVNEIDSIIESLRNIGSFDMTRIGIGGVSAGGMAALVRLCREHQFACASVEATSGSWEHQMNRPMFTNIPPADADRLNPMKHLDGWREIPFQAIHSIGDEWMSIDGQRAFIEALRAKYEHGTTVELIEYERTGALYEHVGFGKVSADAKERQLAFFEGALL